MNVIHGLAWYFPESVGGTEIYVSGLVRELPAYGVVNARTSYQLTKNIQIYGLVYNLLDRQSEGVLDYCAGRGMAFIPWFPVAAGQLTASGGVVTEVARATGATAAQVSLAWLLRRSPAMLPIPGTSTVAHLEENCGAATVKLTEDQLKRLSAVPAPPPS